MLPFTTYDEEDPAFKASPAARLNLMDVQNIKTLKKTLSAVMAQKGDSGRDGKDGKDGATPKRGEDYFTKEEIVTFLKAVTPRKGLHYKDGERGTDGRTPIVSNYIPVQKTNTPEGYVGAICLVDNKDDAHNGHVSISCGSPPPRPLYGDIWIK